MFPTITIFNKTISMYAVMSIIGILTCGIYIKKVCKSKKIDDTKIITMLVVSLIGVFLGSHILYAITRFDLIIAFISRIDRVDSFKLLIDCLYEIFGGSVFYGGLIGGIFVAYLYAKKNKMDISSTFDLVAPLIPLFHFFGRIGCFLVGCCYGIESDIGFTYTHSLAPIADNVNRFPIQLVEALYNIILFFVLVHLSNNKKFQGKIIYLYFIIYPIGRFIFEFFRGDEYRGFLFGLSTSQIISIILFIISVSCLLVTYLKNNKKTKM
ncbi:MAG: prolipoprotein diacylglyceryl transferase [Clostridium sp.]|nr:prolipoprotein diacylglyceryl transferase [Clostridium sp.]MCM1443732.1 prolipoprotein diacylglyceryl transferase [Candidatus Amulumruptor caecigallinarius]